MLTIINRAGDLGLEIVGEEFRVKTVTSLARAFKDELAFEAIDLADFARSQKDRVRFSVQVPENGYGSAVRSLLERLEGRGFSVKKIVNFWGSGGRHNGLNVGVVDPTGFLFEIQFPTALSWAIGKETHKLYEILRQEDFSMQARIAAFLEMVSINKTRAIASHQSTDLNLIPVTKNADSSLAGLIEANQNLWDNYLADLEEAPVFF